MKKTTRPTQQYLVNMCLCKNTMVDGSVHVISCPSVPTMTVLLIYLYLLTLNGMTHFIPCLAPFF